MRISVAVMTLAAAGCGLPGPPTETSRAGACQFRACACVAADAIATPWTRKQPVLWRDSGEAYCEQGYRLQIE